MGYRATWNSTDQVPQRAIDEGLIGRFGALDPSDGGDTYRYSGTLEWQRSQRQRHHQGRRLRHRLRPEPVLELHLLPRRSGARRSVPPGRSPVHHRRARRAIGGSTRWNGREVQNTVGVQVRNDDITNVGLYHTRGAAAARHRPAGRGASRPAAPATRRTRSRGRRGCARSPACASTAIASASTPAIPRTAARGRAGIVSPKGGVVIGPFKGTELYVNAGLGFHSNDARGHDDHARSRHRRRRSIR